MAEQERNASTQFWPGSVGSRARYGRIKRSHQYTEKWDKDLALDVMDYLSTDYSLLLGMAMLMYGEIAKNFEDRRMIEHAEASRNSCWTTWFTLAIASTRSSRPPAHNPTRRWR